MTHDRPERRRDEVDEAYDRHASFIAELGNLDNDPQAIADISALAEYLAIWLRDPDHAEMIRSIGLGAREVAAVLRLADKASDGRATLTECSAMYEKLDALRERMETLNDAWGDRQYELLDDEQDDDDDDPSGDRP
jgi:hypothetical protein